MNILRLIYKKYKHYYYNIIICILHICCKGTSSDLSEAAAEPGGGHHGLAWQSRGAEAAASPHRQEGRAGAGGHTRHTPGRR